MRRGTWTFSATHKEPYIHEDEVEVAMGAKSGVPQIQAPPISKSEQLRVALVLLLFLLAAIHSARLRPFWFDELSTLFIVSTSTVHDMFRAIPTDGNPPLYFLLARLFVHLPVRTELALRLPAILAYLVASLAVYRFARRNVDCIFALLSMCVFMGCSFRSYAIEARAYALLLAFTGVAIVCWQSYCHSGRPKALAGLSLSVAGAIFTHQYGVIYATLPIVIGEAVRILRRRLVDPKVLCALAIPTPALLVTYPVMLRVQKPLLSAIRACPVFFAHPRLIDLKDYAMTLPVPILVPVALTMLALLFKLALSTRRAERLAANVPLEDIAVACTLSFFIPIMLVATHLGTTFFQHRYGIGSALGVALLSGFLLARLPWRHAAALAWSGAVYSMGIGLLGIWLSAETRSTHPWLDPVLQAGDPREPIVVASALEYTPAWWYGDTMRGRLHYLEDLNYAGRHSDLVPEYSLALEHNYTPMHMEEYQAFLGAHRHFLLYCYGEPRLEWIRTRLLQEGWHLALVASAKEKDHDELRSDYRELFRVSR